MHDEVDVFLWISVFETQQIPLRLHNLKHIYSLYQNSSRLVFLFFFSFFSLSLCVTCVAVPRNDTKTELAWNKRHFLLCSSRRCGISSFGLKALCCHLSARQVVFKRASEECGSYWLITRDQLSKRACCLLSVRLFLLYRLLHFDNNKIHHLKIIFFPVLILNDFYVPSVRILRCFTMTKLMSLFSLGSAKKVNMHSALWKR